MTSKTNKKRSKKGGKLLAGLALATALAWGSIPAFAASSSASSSSPSGQPFFNFTPQVGAPSALNWGSNYTEVSGYATDNYEPMIAAKIPIGLYLAFGTAGYSDIVASSPEVYGITNIGGSDIKITDIEVAPISSEFNINAMYEDNGKWFFDDKPVEKNIITLHYDDGTNNTYLAEDHSLKDAIRNDKFLDMEFKPFDTTVIKAGEFQGIDFNKSYSFFPKAISATAEGAYGELCKLTYYIEEN